MKSRFLMCCGAITRCAVGYDPFYVNERGQATGYSFTNSTPNPLADRSGV